MLRIKGFTVLEILLTIAILTLAVTIVIVSLSKLNSSQALDKSASLAVSILDEARSLTLSAKNDSQYGVYLGSSEMVLFKGAVYASTDPSNIITPVDGRVGIDNISFVGGGSSVVFKRLTGYTDEAGTFDLFLKASTTLRRTVTVAGTGIVSVSSQ